MELRLIAELLKNSRRSDRELAKAIDVSQPTISRAIKRLEKRGAIKEYTIVPDFAMLGFELMALTFIRIKPTLDQTEASEARKMAEEKVKESPANIIMLERGMGLNHTGVVISFHKNYTDYTRFVQAFREARTSQAYVDENIESFLIELNDKIRYRPLTLAKLADSTLKMSEKKESKDAS